MSRPFVTELLDKKHVRTDFSCGEHILDIYIKQYARQDQKRRTSAVFVLSGGEEIIKGYYTLSATNILSSDLPNEFVKRLPKHPVQPATLLGRLAVDRRYQGQGLGEILLLDALNRSYRLSEQIGSMAIVVEALNERAASFYEAHGFITLSGCRRLFLPMKTVGKLF
jgi:ribosomal protein S18 acetylase RimI-like enzyme